MRCHWKLPETWSSARQARELTRSAIDAAHGHPSLAEPAALVVSELVANALVHTDGPMVLTVEVTPNHVHVEVEDRSTDPPHHERARPEDMSGRGLLIVARLSDRWGWRPVDDVGKVVWCELEAGEALAHAMGGAG